MSVRSRIQSFIEKNRSRDVNTLTTFLTWQEFLARAWEQLEKLRAKGK